jgi:hypothetical protein
MSSHRRRSFPVSFLDERRPDLASLLLGPVDHLLYARADLRDGIDARVGTPVIGRHRMAVLMGGTL